MKLIAPIVHLNGTSKESLRGQYRTAAAAIRDAGKTLNLIETHDRDYYVHSLPQAGQRAREQKRQWLILLDRIHVELSAIHLAIHKGEPTTPELQELVY